VRRLALLCEVLRPPFDEGIRIVAARIAAALAKECEVLLLGEEDAVLDGIPVRGVLTDRFFAGRALADEISRFRPQALLYVPWTSLTARSFLRVRALRHRSGGAPVGVVALQPRGSGWLTRRASRLGAPDRLFAIGPEVERQAEALGLACHRLRGGVDTERFTPLGQTNRPDLRRALGLRSSAYIVLHVGHLKRSRGIEILQKLQAIEGVQTILVASSSTRAEAGTRRNLQAAGVRVIDHHLEAIEEYYRSADCYLFPVTSAVDAIELPLSVLEAMACNLPIVSTRFGGVPALLEGAGPGVALADSAEEIVASVRAFMASPPVPTLRERVMPLTWIAMARRILDSLRKAIEGAAFRNSEIGK